MISVGEARTKPAAIDHRSGKARIFPQVGSPGRCGQDLAVVGVDVVGGNVGQFVRAEQELVGDDIGAELACPSNVAVHPKIAHCIERLELEPEIVGLGIVESIEDIGLAELSVIQQIARELEIAIKADFETRNRPDLLHHARIKHMGAFRQHRIVLGHLGGYHRALRECDIGRRGNHLLRRREGSGIAGVDGGALLRHPGQADARAELVGVGICHHLIEAQSGVERELVGHLPFVLDVGAKQKSGLRALIQYIEGRV